jgi:hypothetical protein
MLKGKSHEVRDRSEVQSISGAPSFLKILVPKFEMIFLNSAYPVFLSGEGFSEDLVAPAW